MGYIHCCGGKRKTKSYAISPEKDYFMAELDYLEECPVCGHTVTQLTRIDFENKISICRKTNQKAKKLFDNLKNLILFERNKENKVPLAKSAFYLNYNEYGTKKKCYSNLSTLKMGKFENKNNNYDSYKILSSTILTKAETSF